MSKTSIGNRMVHYDLMRVIACFCVIVIHAGIFNQSADWSNQSFERMIGNFYVITSRWAVPCFVMLSGMMFLNKNKEISFKNLYGHYILRLFTSYVFWSCIYALYNSLYMVSGGINEYIKYFVNYCFSGELHMWYILMTIGLYIALPIIKYIVLNAPQSLIKYWLVAMFIFASIIPFICDLNIPYISGTVAYLNEYIEVQFLCGYTLFFVLGSIIATNNLSLKLRKLIYVLGIGGFLYCIFVLCVLKYFINSELGALNYLYPNIVFMSISVFLFFKDKVSQIKFSDKAKYIIVGMSKLTYGVYLLHVLVLKILYRLGLNLSFCNIVISIPLIALITFVICMIVIFLISKIPFINKYIC